MATVPHHDLLDHQLRSIYGAELQLLTALPRLISKVQNQRLSPELTEYRRTTKAHAVRIEGCFSLLGRQARYDLCMEMTEMLDDAIESVQSDRGAHPQVELPTSMQLLTQFKLALYANAMILANAVDQSMIASLLDRSIVEERSAEATWDALVVAAGRPRTFSASRRVVETAG